MSSRDSNRLWRALEAQRFFLVPQHVSVGSGAFRVLDEKGASRELELAELRPYEVTEAQARNFARDDLAHTLEELRRSADEKLAEWREKLEASKRRPIAKDAKATSDLGPALLGLLKDLPGVLAQSLSGAPARVDAAKETMAQLQRRLRDAGVDLDDRFTGFPDRLARLRQDVERQRAAASAERTAASANSEEKKPGA